MTLKITLISRKLNYICTLRQRNVNNRLNILCLQGFAANLTHIFVYIFLIHK